MPEAQPESSSPQERGIRDNSLEREFSTWRSALTRGPIPTFVEESLPVPEYLYHVTRASRQSSIIKEGLVAHRPHLMDKWREDALVVYASEKEELEEVPVVKIKTDPLDPSWIYIGADFIYGITWMHAGNIPPEQIVSVKDLEEGILVGKGGDGK